MLSPKIIIAFWYFLVSDAQLQSSVERSCPGETVTFTCTIPSLAHRWEASGLDMPRSLVPGDRGGVISDPPFQFNVTEVIPGTSITSTATVTATSDLNGTLVVCQDGLGILPDQSSIINIRGKHGVSLYIYVHGIGISLSKPSRGFLSVLCHYLDNTYVDW